MFKKHFAKALALVVISLAAGIGLVAFSEVGPWNITDSNGQSRITLNTDGSVQAAYHKMRDSTSNVTFATVAGVAVTGWTPTGVHLTLAANDNTGALTLAGTTEVTQTFTTTEADTNYYIIGVLETTASVTDTVSIKRKNTTSFVVGNGPSYNGPVYRWAKFRHTQ